MAIRVFGPKRPKIHETAYVDDAAVLIGDVVVGADSSIWPCAVLRADLFSIQIGERTSIQDGTVMHVTPPGEENPDGYPVVVGDEVTVGHRVILHGCHIEGHSLIGMGSMVMDGAVVEQNVLLAAGSVVGQNRRLEGGFLWAGNPARKLRELTEDELEYFKYGAEVYQALKDQHKKNQ